MNHRGEEGEDIMLPLYDVRPVTSVPILIVWYGDDILWMGYRGRPPRICRARVYSCLVVIS
jgi:hypothetical protein